MSAVMDLSLFRTREAVAQLGTVMAGLFIIVLSQTIVMRQEAPVQEAPINLTIVPPPVVPEPIIEQPVRKIQPPKPEKVVETPVKEIAATVSPAPTPTPAPAPALVSVPVPPVLPEKKIEPANVPPQVQRSSNGAAEGLFAQDVRSRIEHKKIYPEAARDLGMSGEVEVLYELDRTGNLIRAEIVSSSGYRLLDQAALSAVKSASYKGFPEDAWLGVSSKVFRTKLIFSINQ